MKSWLPYDESSHFPLENIPFGAFLNPRENKVHCCTRIGDHIIDLSILEHERLFDGPVFSYMDHHVFCEETLNKFMAHGKKGRIEARESIQKLFSADGDGASKITD